MKKNVMVILCDQLRADFLSCYNPDSPVQTKNIDALSRDGMLFSHAITASPVCAPGRACMMTGRYVSDHGVWTNDVPFRDGMDYLPARMKQNGYRCGTFGKLHHFPKRDHKGFDVAWQMEENRLGEADDYLQYLKAHHDDADQVFMTDQNSQFKYPPEEYYESQIACRTMDFIAQSDAPFFTWVSFQGPHTPMDPPRVDYAVDQVPAPLHPDFDPPCEVARYRKSRTDFHTTEDTARYRLDYAKMLEFIDGKIGDLVAFLKKSGRYDDTVILFSTDHGDLCGDYNMREKGPYLYQSQLAVPLIVANHQGLSCGEHSNLLTSNLDIASTILSVAGDDKPLGFSRDIAKMVADPSYRRQTLYAEFCDSVKLICDHAYRFAYYPFSGQYELVKIEEETHDLSTDPAYLPRITGYLKEIIDYMILAKGVQIEAQDLTPKVQQGLALKLPNYKDEIPLVFPIASEQQRDCLTRDGLDADFNEFCKSRPILRWYSRYWD